MTRNSISGLSDERWAALARFLAGESDAGQAEEMRAWLAERPDREQLASGLEDALHRLAWRTPADLDVEAALSDVRTRIDEPGVLPIGSARQEPRHTFRRTNLLRLAAGIALVIGAGVVWRATQREAPPTRDVAAVETHATAIGQTESLRLSDGTSVLLAPGSRLVVSAGYGATSRAVELTGEALFDVIHDAARPFTVHAGDAAVEDLGTTFAVRSGVDGVRVVVTVGAVRLRAENAPVEAGIVLRAGQRGVLAARTVDVVQSAATDEDLAWTHGRLVFVDAPLDRVRDDLLRWYGIELRVSGQAPGSLNAAFEEGETVEQVLEIIGLALGADIDRRGDTAIVRVRPGGTPR